MTVRRHPVAKVNLRHLRALTLVAETGTVRAGADAAGLSQPAVTLGLAQLEAYFGRPLFERHHAGMQINSDGAILNFRIKRLFAFLAEMKRRIDMARRNRRGPPVDKLVSMVQLRTLIAVAETKGFSAAAREMNVSEPTVHRAAREFEKMVGVPLFQTVRSGVEMTSIGQDVMRLANLALKELDTAVEELAEADGKRRGRIVIGSLPLARTELLPHAIAMLYDGDPFASVEIFEGPYATLMHMLRTGGVDMIIGALRDPLVYDDVTQSRLFDDDLSVIARAGHPLTEKEEITLDDLAGYPWAIPRKETPTRGHFETLFASVQPEFGLLETSSMVILRALLIRSDRLTLLSRRQILYEEQQGLLIALSVELAFTRRAIGVTTRSNWQPTRLQKRFLDLIREVSLQNENDIGGETVMAASAEPGRVN
jgi:DNA-binding transcriptional LysR family regulator